MILHSGLAEVISIPFSVAWTKILNFSQSCLFDTIELRYLLNSICKYQHFWYFQTLVIITLDIVHHPSIVYWFIPWAVSWHPNKGCVCTNNFKFHTDVIVTHCVLGCQMMKSIYIFLSEVTLEIVQLLRHALCQSWLSLKMKDVKTSVQILQMRFIPCLSRLLECALR